MTSAILATSAKYYGSRKNKKSAGPNVVKNEKCNKNFLRPKNHKESVSIWIKISRSFCGKKYKGKCFLTVTSQNKMGVKVLRDPQDGEQCACFNIWRQFWQDLSCDSNDRAIVSL